MLDARGVLVAYSGEDGGGLFRPDIALIEKFSKHNPGNFAGARPPLWMSERITPTLVTSQG